MAKVPVVTPDGAKIRQLIKESRWKRVTPFARSLRNPQRHEQSIWNILGSNIPTSESFMRQIAEALGVEVGEITLSGEAQDEAQPDDQADAA
jgi:hypothetical protein